MLDTVFNLLKVTAVLLVASVFMVAILGLLNLIQTVVLGNVIAEFFALISMYLPFNALAVFGAIGVSTVAILSFLIAKKLNQISSWQLKMKVLQL